MLTLKVNSTYKTSRGLKAVMTDLITDDAGLCYLDGYAVLEDGREVSTKWDIHGNEHCTTNEHRIVGHWEEEKACSLRIPDSQKEHISKMLADIVLDFNTKFSEWMEATGCYANFEWVYSGDSPKQMGIKDIDARIFKKPQPKFENGQVLKR